MKWTQVLTGMVICMAITPVTLSSTSSEIREFIRTTNLMKKFGVRIATSLSKKKKKSKLGLLLGIEPTSVILMPEDFDLKTKKITKSAPHSDLVPLPDKIYDMKLVCYNEKVREIFPEWGIVDLCKGEAQEIFSKYMKSLSSKRARLAITRGDLEDAPIIQLGRLKCMNLHGPCLTPRPSDVELASILSSKEESSVLITLTTIVSTRLDSSSSSASPSTDELATVTVVVTTTSIIQTVSTTSSAFKASPMHIKILISKPVTSMTSVQPNPMNKFKNTLERPPLYAEDPALFESYLSWIKTIATTSTFKTDQDVFGIKLVPHTARTRFIKISQTIQTITTTAADMRSNDENTDKIFTDLNDLNEKRY
ncbi:putative powdery mildew-specific protein [Golovinomyces cichoracearum]|uniref:Putative powdery mildew-specific protein n=1 Tax=Golovinomyces cichoracearum TaxID=62708 RepID=A0A420HUT0_9PEZI|nr:putative powdery mildew-specific protein [Golovinomyces cichoracearum]